MQQIEEQERRQTVLSNLPRGITHLTDESFARVVKSSPVPVFVDFWAAWCRPCAAIAPALEKISTEYHGKLLVAKLNIDEHPRTPGLLNVASIPTMLIFNGGKVVDRLIGAMPEAQLRARINQSLEKIRRMA